MASYTLPQNDQVLYSSYTAGGLKAVPHEALIPFRFHGPSTTPGLYTTPTFGEKRDVLLSGYFVRFPLSRSEAR